MFTSKSIFSALVHALFITSAFCFTVPSTTVTSTSTLSSSSSSAAAAAAATAKTTTVPLFMVPRYNNMEGKWEAMTDKDKPEAGYGPFGSLLRAGPLPFIQRFINAEGYEQGVLKFMASEGCDRVEAQGNFDAYLENPQDWAYQKMQEKQGKPKKDYATANTSPKQIILSTVWAGIVVWFFYEFISDALDGKWVNANRDLLHGNLWDLSGLGL